MNFWRNETEKPVPYFRCAVHNGKFLFHCCFGYFVLVLGISGFPPIDQSGRSFAESSVETQSSKEIDFSNLLMG